MSWFAGALCVLQDDANFIARVDPRSGTVDAVALPRGAGGRRLFDDGTGNKAHKLDLEACVMVSDGAGERLLAFGSGSTAAREHIVTVRRTTPGAPLEVHVVHAPAFYADLRGNTSFAGSELNVEGVVLLPDGHLRLFQRGNGAPRGDLAPVDATVDVAWEDLRGYLERGGDRRPPRLGRVVQYDLGAVDGVRLTFTDAALAPNGDIVYLAGAEDSPDTVQDGAVAGAAVGILHAGRARWTHLADHAGRPLAVKAEGLALHHDGPDRAHVALDPDRADVATELCDVALDGPWS